MQFYGAIVTAAAAFLAVLIAAGITYWSTKRIKLREWQFLVLKEQVLEKRSAYADLIARAYSISTAATADPATKLTEVSALDAAFARIELMGSPEVVRAAEDLVGAVLDKFDRTKPYESDRFVKTKSAFLKLARAELSEIEHRAARELV